MVFRERKNPEPGTRSPELKGGRGMGRREYVSVVADYAPDGTVMPVSVRFADGPAFGVDRVISAIHMSSTKQNGEETRYSVRIGDREHDIFFEDAREGEQPRWFVLDVDK